jgi:hypothetical protein
MNRDAPAGPAASTSTKRTTLSELMLEFASPLLALDKSGAADPDVLRQLMILVDMCWNLPVLERTDPAAYTKVRQGFDTIVSDLPGPLADQLHQLLDDRTERYGSVPFLVQTHVETDAAGKARLTAEARKPRA